MGVGRIAVRRCTQALPYCRADVELLIDPEDQAAFEPLALQVSLGCGGLVLLSCKHSMLFVTAGWRQGNR